MTERADRWSSLALSLFLLRVVLHAIESASLVLKGLRDERDDDLCVFHLLTAALDAGLDQLKKFGERVELIDVTSRYY